MKSLFFILALFSGFLHSQEKQYKLLTTDQYNNKWYYSFEKEVSDGFYTWLKSEETLQNNPSTKSTEYFIEFKCSNQTMSDEIVIINWREGKPDIYNKKYPFVSIPKKHVGNALIAQFCK